MKPIGGFFELETGRRNTAHHSQGSGLTSGRACLAWILSCLPARRVYLPFFTCDALLQPIIERGLEYRWYSLDRQFRPDPLPEITDQDCFVYINYFGLFSEVAHDLAQHFSERLILDNTQAFFETSTDPCWSFNSARKFFGVSDGAYLYGPSRPPNDLPANLALGWDHLLLRIQGLLPEARTKFLEHENKVDSRVLGMSPVSERLLGNIDYPLVKQRRRSNFHVYEEQLGKFNQLAFCLSDDAVPFCYPFLPRRAIDKSELHAQQIFVPTLWNDVIERSDPGFEFERLLSRELLALPLDHRYDASDCYSVCQIVRKMVLEQKT